MLNLHSSMVAGDKKFGLFRPASRLKNNLKPTLSAYGVGKPKLSAMA